MSTALTFAFRDKALRVEMIDGEPWWVAADLCALLGILNVTNAVKKLPSDMATLYPIKGIGKGGPVNLVSEPGMWLLVSRSDKPEAQEVILWLCREVLPSLRKHGYYQMPGFEPPPMQALDFDPSRLAVGVSVVRTAMKLYGPAAARGLWVQVGLPPIMTDSEGALDTDPLAQPLHVYLDGRAATTIEQAANGIGIADPDHSTRYRIGKLLHLWGWTAKNEKVARGRTARVFRRPPSGMTIDQDREAGQ